MRLTEPTRICKICFKEFSINSTRTLISKNIHVCDKCFQKYKAKFTEFKIDKIKGISIYDYDESIRELIYQFKGCYDIELGSLFLEPYIKYIRYKYKGYYLLPIPSYYKDDARREFNHVIEAFNALKLPYLSIVEKKDEYKQSDQRKEDRINIKYHLKVSDLENIKNKKILLVDDVITTGSTLRACINLIKPGHPKDIKILTIAKTKHHS